MNAEVTQTAVQPKVGEVKQEAGETKDISVDRQEQVPQNKESSKT